MGPRRGDLVENEWKPLETEDLQMDGRCLRMARCKVSCPPPSSITGTQAARPTAPFAAGTRTRTGTGDRPGVGGFARETHQTRCMARAESGEATSPGLE